MILFCNIEQFSIVTPCCTQCCNVWIVPTLSTPVPSVCSNLSLPSGRISVCQISDHSFFRSLLIHPPSCRPTRFCIQSIRKRKGLRDEGSNFAVEASMELVDVLWSPFGCHVSYLSCLISSQCPTIVFHSLAHGEVRHPVGIECTSISSKHHTIPRQLVCDSKICKKKIPKYIQIPSPPNLSRFICFRVHRAKRSLASLLRSVC